MQMGLIEVCDILKLRQLVNVKWIDDLLCDFVVFYLLERWSALSLPLVDRTDLDQRLLFQGYR